MKDHHLKINNSYESEVSSNSGSSSLEESTYENRSFDGAIPKLQELFKPQYYVIGHFNEQDAVKTDKARNRKLKISDNVVYSSQESDFLGFPIEKKSAIKARYRKTRISSNAISPSEEADFLGFSPNMQKKVEEKIYTSSQESDFAGFSVGSIGDETPAVLPVTEEKEVENSCEPKKSCTLVCEILVSTEEKSVAKPAEGTEIFDMVNADNSCNAVYMKLSDEVSCTASGTKLSFNGTIKASSQMSLEECDSLISENKKVTLDLEGETNQTYKYDNEKSPDLFDDEDDEDETDACSTKYFQEQFNESGDDISFVNDVSGKERELLKRIQKSLSGIPPPPSVTIMQIDMFTSVTKNKENIFNFFKDVDPSKSCENEIIFKPTHSLEEIKVMKWPDTLNARSHGLCYNLSTVTERIELLGLSVLERYIGAETCSSFQISPSSAKKRNVRMKMLSQSPGNRLSHLARRRAIFSSANLQSNSQKVSIRKIGNKQILLDTKKSENRRKQKIITPKRRTPGKRKITRKTPSSSAKKRLLFRTDQTNTAPSRETSKRALFQSPPQQQKIISKPLFKPEIANRVEKSKRALFSPEKPGSSVSSSAYDSETHLSINNENFPKRRREDDDLEGNSTKLLKIDSSLSNVENLTPRSFKVKSQSFCVGSGTRGSLDTISGKSLFRASSDTTFCSSQLSESHKKKLLWAVSQALQSKQIGVKHPNFKQYASVLARTVKRLFLETCQKSGSTSDTMLRLAKRHVFWVTQGKTADEIYLQEKIRLEQEKSLAPKLAGYIAPEEYENRQILAKKCSQSAIFSENSMDSFNLSQSLGCNFTQSSQNSEFMSQISQDSLLTKECRYTNAKKLPIQKSPSLQNSSSKNNLGGSALRENVDCELRRSAQKNFTGKDQKNLSPYTDRARSSAKKYSSNIYETNPMKVKRQISFDS